MTSSAQRPQAPSSGCPLATRRRGQQADAVDARPERRQQRGQERDRRHHRDRRDQHPADPDRADERQRQHDHREQSDRDRRAGDDHRAAGVRHRLNERGLDVAAVAELVAEAEDHQQRVVDRDAEPDERDQELDDDRDVREVGEHPDEREGVEDRRDRDRDRHQHRRQRAEDEEEDDERPGAADQPLGEHARALAAARCGLERQQPGEVACTPCGVAAASDRRTHLGDTTDELKLTFPGG